MTEVERLRETEDFTVLWTFIPDLSAYQVLFILLVSLSQTSAGSLQLSQIILQVAPDNITCVGTNTSGRSIPFETITFLQSTESNLNLEIGCVKNCHEYKYDFTLFNETVTSEFDLICDKESYPAYISSITFVGLFFGALSTGFCSDKFGRKRVIGFTTFFALGYCQLTL